MTAQNGDYIAPENSKMVIDGFDDALLGHTYDSFGQPILIYSVDLMLDQLESESPEDTEDQLLEKFTTIELRYSESVIFLFT